MRFQASAPGRYGILGNPSDIYGGKVISMSIPARATCTLESSETWDLPSDTTLWDACTHRYPLEGAWKVTWQTDVPRSSGLAGSTALLAATFATVLAARGEAHLLENRVWVAETVRDIERYEAGVMCGFQDAYMVVHGGTQIGDYAGKHPVNPGPPATLTTVDLPFKFLLVTTGVERLSGSVHGPMAERWIKGEQEVVDGISFISGLPDMFLGVSENSPPQPAFQRLTAGFMSGNQATIQLLGGSGEAIDTLCADCLACGAEAAKLAGAGMGGTVLALCEDPDILETKLREKGYTRFIKPEAVEGLRLEENQR